MPEGVQKGLTNVSQGAQQLAKNVQTGASNVVEFGKNLGNKFNTAVDGVKNSVSKFGSSVVEGAQNVGKSITGFAADQADKALEVLEKKIKPTIKDILDKNPLLKKISSFVSNPKEAGNRVLDFVGDGLKKAQKNPLLKGTLNTLKKARAAAKGQLGPLDKIITVLESVIRYGMGEAPVNAIALALANLFGYAAGFAAASIVPGLGQSGFFNMMGGILGSMAAEEMTKFGLSKLLQVAPDLGQIEDPISAKIPEFQKRPLLRDPYLSFDDYRKSINMKGGKFFGMNIPNLLGGASENTTQSTQSSGSVSTTRDTSPQVNPQERLMGGGVGKYSPLFDLIAAHEGNYNSINRSKAGDSPGGAAKYFGKNLTDMTVGEIMELQSQRKLYAAGKYQIVPSTMKDFVARGGVKKSDMFNSKTQEKFPEYVVKIKRPIVGKYFEGKASLEDAVINLAAEFASIGVPRDMKRGEFGSGYPKSDRPKGSTFYGGTSNRAHTTPESVAAALQSIKGGATQEDQQSSEVKKVMKEQNMTKEEAERYISSDMESGPGPVDASYSGGSTSAQVDDSEKGETKLPEVNPQGGGGSGGESMTSEPEQAKLEPPPTGGGGGGPSSSAQSVSKRASYEQGADQDLVIPLPQQQNGGGGMMRSKSRVMMMGGNSLDRYYKAQLLGALYKRG